MRRKLLTVALLILIVGSSFAACNPSDKRDDTEKGVTYGDIYVSHEGIAPYDTVTLLTTLPEGVSPYSVKSGSALDYDSAYIEDDNLLICEKTEGTTKYLGVYSFEQGKMLGEGVVYSSLTYSYGYLVLANKSGKHSLMRADGTFVISEEDGYPKFGETDVKNVFIPLSKKYIAVHSNNNTLYNIYDNNGVSVKKTDGTPFAVSSKYYGKNNYSIFGLKVYDNYLVSSVYSGTTVQTENSIVYYDLAQNGNRIYDVFSACGAYPTTGTAARRAYYLGNGKLYCYETRTDTADESSYQFELDDKFYKASVWTYDLKSGVKTTLTTDVFYAEIINAYNSPETTLVAEYYLQKGYSLGNKVYIRQADKTIMVEQYIIDSDLNVYVSFYDHSGTATVYSANNDTQRDVVLTYVGDIGFFTDTKGASPAAIMLYDDKGNTVLKKSGYYYDVFYNNGIVTAAKAIYDTDGTTVKDVVYAAYNIDGTQVFDADTQAFSYMTAYVGTYSLVADDNNKMYIIDNHGQLVRDITSEILHTDSNTLYVKAGVYGTKGSNGLLGLKSYNGTVLFENENNNLVLLKRGTSQLLAFSKKDGVWSISSIK